MRSCLQLTPCNSHFRSTNVQNLRGVRRVFGADPHAGRSPMLHPAPNIRRSSMRSVVISQDASMGSGDHRSHRGEQRSHGSDQSDKPNDITDDGDFHYAVLGPRAASTPNSPSAEARRFLDNTARCPGLLGVSEAWAGPGACRPDRRHQQGSRGPHLRILVRIEGGAEGNRPPDGVVSTINHSLKEISSDLKLT